MDDAKGNLLTIRADADSQIGTGHFMRSLALGQAWMDAGGRVAFLTCCNREALLRRLEQQRFAVQMLPARHPDPRDIRDTLRTLGTSGRGWLSLDGYFFDPLYHQAITEEGNRLLAFDDNALLDRYLVDVLLNQNLHAESLSYRTRADTVRLLGTQYVMLRREFRLRRVAPRPVADTARKVLVTLGGSDPANVTGRVLADLDQVRLGDLKVTVVVGPDNRWRGTLEEAAARARHPVQLVSDAENMPQLMAESDVAITGGGTTLWELAYMGLPALALVMAENQARAVEALQSRGVLQSLGDPTKLPQGTAGRALEALSHDAGSRARMACAGQELVDAQGPRRVLKTLFALQDPDEKP